VAKATKQVENPVQKFKKGGTDDEVLAKRVEKFANSYLIGLGKKKHRKGHRLLFKSRHKKKRFLDAMMDPAVGPLDVKTRDELLRSIYRRYSRKLGREKAGRASQSTPEVPPTSPVFDYKALALSLTGAISARYSIPVETVRQLVAGLTKEKAKADRLQDVLTILTRLESFVDDKASVINLYREHKLTGFKNKTAEQLVRDGFAEAVNKHIDRMLAGGFA
jgi:hypothetical protein